MGEVGEVAAHGDPLMMFCRNCGNALDAQAAVCVRCGVAAGVGSKFCHNCSSSVDPVAAVCLKCGAALAGSGATAVAFSGQPRKSKVVAGLLGIFLGGFGVHRFYLGFNLIGAIQVLLTVVGGILTCGFGWIAGAMWGFVEGILIFAGQINKDAQGRPLAD